MSKLMKLSMKTKVLCLVLTFVVGFLTFAGITYTSICEIRVGGPHYKAIVCNKDLLADTVPPTLYIVESYLSTHLMQDSPDADARAAAIARYRKFKKAFDDRLATWSDKLEDGEIKTILTKQVAKTAEAIFTTIERDLIPAIEKDDTETMDSVSLKLEKLFYEHKVPVEKLVSSITETLISKQSQAESMASSRIWVLTVVGISMMLMVMSISFWLQRSIAKTEGVLLDNAGKIASIERAQAIIEFKMDGTIITANQNFLATTGYSMDEIKGKHHSMLVSAGVRNSSDYRSFWENLNRGQVQAGDVRRVAKGGKEIWLRVSYNPIINAAGKPFKVVKFATEVTAELNRNAEFEGQIAAVNKSQAIIEFGLDGTVLNANKNFLDTLGYSLDEVKGRHHRMFVSEDERQSPEYSEFWAKLNRGEHQAAEFKRVGKSGRVVYFQASYNPINDLNGKPFKVVQYATNTTAAAVAREDLKTKVSQILTVVNAAACGDLTQSISVTGDDPIGQMGKSLASFFGDLRKSMASISENAIALGGASEELATVSSQMSANADETSSQANVVSVASEQVSANVQIVAAGVDEMNVAIREIAKSASEAARVSQQAVTVASDTNRTISKLGDSSLEIGKVVKVITSIAEQTNLLALNATIEAARAGDAGKGFAVVANEVKELAKETARATEDISMKIGTIQTDTQGAVLAIRQISEIINQINDISNTIASAIEEQTATSNEMGRNVSQASDGSVQISQNITSVASAALHTTQGAANTQRSASELSQMAANLNQLVSRFQFQHHELKSSRESRPRVPITNVGTPQTNTFQSV